MPGKLICPECGEEALNKPPRSITPQMRADGAPQYSHHDGEPLCPVVSDSGYRPAEPIRSS
ncbi:uncharacterized Zn finger protein (UPF0148 family) [Saccharopolyspora lacisalsi]|uniref:Uncharacterized Zn finger protein (UPF0148 family) n=1 Tax=Halosaccharopolyspora lacisalsi TaxID=1000566 RepID=A0A839DWB5_9PSEU|nr:hypothetical protein [Halosaccharopolyspora lacisalsi]MBA8825313.1 uncharacterized Zn finger protein (UPF0148 family) [Halosaccharopolyspora lacisalsi]